MNGDVIFQEFVLYEYSEAGLFSLTTALILHDTHFDD